MVEAQSWTTRRSSNPRFETSVDIPSTPTGELRHGTSNNLFSATSFLSPTILTALIIASWYFSNIGVLLLNKYLLSFYGYRLHRWQSVEIGGARSVINFRFGETPFNESVTVYGANGRHDLIAVLGNAKAAVAAVVSVLIFKNPVTVLGISGFGVTIMGVVLYSEAKRRLKITAH
ncbi:hypothetical protein L1987_05096 [Smallanthus sonchifolius]|uniref:Uncharacterized protein n=1 Tax=Smallanthus sonchifolius TaxID=185202 RepID=A0ACB9JUE2_9ASTR|nr:hypothetical protein L1987_05096 [Smallanthus sonchifolius]